MEVDEPTAGNHPGLNNHLNGYSYGSSAPTGGQTDSGFGAGGQQPQQQRQIIGMHGHHSGGFGEANTNTTNTYNNAEAGPSTTSSPPTALILVNSFVTPPAITGEDGKPKYWNPTVGPNSGVEATLHKEAHGSTEWKYEMRREAQQIIPGLILGPLQISKNRERLRELEVTHVDKSEAPYVKPRFEGELDYYVVDLKDNEDSRIIKDLAKSHEFISKAINAGGTVFVHCGSGISLSPTLVLAYLMETHQMSYEQALSYLQSKRYCVAPNPGFALQLKEFEPIYKARLAMSKNPLIGARASASNMGSDYNGLPADGNGGAGFAKQKRTMDDMSDDENDMETKQPIRNEPASNVWIKDGQVVMEED